VEILCNIQAGSFESTECTRGSHQHSTTTSYGARQTLGVRVALDGNNAAKFGHLLQVATEWYMAMKVGRMTHEAAAFSLWHVVIKQLTYPLVTTTFTEKECTAIMQPILVAGLPAMGIV